MQLNVTLFTRTLAAAALTVGLTATAFAQGMFSPAIKVNDDVITHYELEQRIQFLTLLRAPGDPVELARKALIDERLRMQAVRETDIEVTDEQIKAGIEEFAQRTQLSADDFIRALGQGGVQLETLRDFVRTGLAWREFSGRTFLEQARPSRMDIDRAMAKDTESNGVSVLLSEVIIPITPETLEDAEALAQEIASIRTYEGFAAAARQYSASDTRDVGGRLNWLPLNNLPPPLRPVILALKPGEVSAPIPLPNAIAVFQMRGIQEIVGPAPRYASIDYAMYYIAGGRSPEALAAAQALKARVDRCDDLYGIAKGQSPEVLERVTQAPGAIPRDVALELAHLDDGEVSTSLTRNNGQTLVFLMMCGRTALPNEGVSRDDIANRLTQERVAQFAEAFIEKKRNEARIVDQ